MSDRRQPPRETDAGTWSGPRIHAPSVLADNRAAPSGDPGKRSITLVASTEPMSFPVWQADSSMLADGIGGIRVAQDASQQFRWLARRKIRSKSTRGLMSRV